MSKKQTTNKTTAPVKEQTSSENQFYWSDHNNKFMLAGLALIVIGFILMLGPDANTNPAGKFDPNYWNEDIFSVRRIRIAPFFIISGFVIEVYAILSKKK